MKDISNNIHNSSPIRWYWLSQQTDFDEAKRLSIANEHSKASILFLHEPYKWETIYQTCLLEIMNGEISQIRSLLILLSCINEAERLKVLEFLKYHDLVNASTLEMLKNGDIPKRKKSINIHIFLKVLFNIFTNPYNLSIKRNKKHIYEYSGAIIHQIKLVIN